MALEAQLARDIIKEQFGPVVLPVADLLVQRFPGFTSLSTLIAQCAPTPPPTVRRALLVLFRHNLIDVSKKPPVDKYPGPLIYAIKLHGVTDRLHFPGYSQQAQELFGDIVSS